MRTLLALIALLTLTGCINITTQTQPSNPTVKPILEGSDCVPIIFGLGAGTASIEKAMMNGTSQPFAAFTNAKPVVTPIRTVHRVQSTEAMFLFFGERCVEVTGE